MSESTVWHGIEAPMKSNAETMTESFKHPPVEVTEERFNEMLNILPPMKWRGGGGSQSFMICELTYADVTAIFCEAGGKFYELADSFTLTHDEIIAKCRAVAS